MASTASDAWRSAQCESFRRRSRKSSVRFGCLHAALIAQGEVRPRGGADSGLQSRERRRLSRRKWLHKRRDGHESRRVTHQLKAPTHLPTGPAGARQTKASAANTTAFLLTRPARTTDSYVCSSVLSIVGARAVVVRLLFASDGELNHGTSGQPGLSAHHLGFETTTRPFLGWLPLWLRGNVTVIQALSDLGLLVLATELIRHVLTEKHAHRRRSGAMTMTAPLPSLSSRDNTTTSSKMSSQRVAEKTTRSDEEEELSCASPDSKGDIDSDDTSSLKYVSVDELNWSSGAKKRARMTDDERKARHREVQRQFMLRKLARLEEMRRQVSFLEKQHLLLLLSQERARLELENELMQRQVAAQPELLIAEPAVATPTLAAMSERHSVNLFSWDEILDAVVADEYEPL